MLACFLSVPLVRVVLSQLSSVFVVVVVNVIFSFLVVLGLRCFAPVFPSCSERGLLFVAMFGLLIAVASLVAEH